MIKLPEIDSSSPESWARTWCEKVLAYMDAPPDAVYIDEGPEAGQPYDAENFRADVGIGDIPWDDETQEKVFGIIKQHPRSAEIDVFFGGDLFEE